MQIKQTALNLDDPAIIADVLIPVPPVAPPLSQPVRDRATSPDVTGLRPPPKA